LFRSGNSDYEFLLVVLVVVFYNNLLLYLISAT
jgi:hypothetical protein